MSLKFQVTGSPLPTGVCRLPGAGRAAVLGAEILGADFATFDTGFFAAFFAGGFAAVFFDALLPVFAFARFIPLSMPQKIAGRITAFPCTGKHF
jgi:hypothetical protein